MRPAHEDDAMAKRRPAPTAADVLLLIGRMSEEERVTLAREIVRRCDAHALRSPKATVDTAEHPLLEFATGLCLLLWTDERSLIAWLRRGVETRRDSTLKSKRGGRRPANAEHVARMADLAKQGLTPGQIAKRLTAEGRLNANGDSYTYAAVWQRLRRAGQ